MGLNDDFFIFMEYMPGGDLYRYLENRGKNARKFENNQGIRKIKFVT
jgi:serine/threonine protein kinase